ncbi:MAG TPA: hypothetical protein PKE07_09570 [Lacibacter sp.]|nr:hypothetical protein [Lacibacter sp.]HMO89446.1 hypothetical protein [Lacibacter sp.]
MQNVLTQQNQVAAIGQHIGFEAGEEMVKAFFDKFPDQAYGNIMGREIIEKILAQPDCQGILITPGLDAEGKRHVVLAGVDSNGKGILQVTCVDSKGELSTEEGIIGDRDQETLDWGIR